MWRATLASLTAHKVRFASTALSIVLGVSFVVGTLIFGDTLDDTFTNLFVQTGEGVDIEITAVQAFEQTFGPPGEATVPEGVADEVSEVDGVADLELFYEGTATLIGADGEPVGGQGPPTLGVDAPTISELDPFELRDGRYPETGGEIAIDASTAEAQSWAVGDTVLVAVDGPAREQEIVGVVGFGDLDNLAGVTLTVFDDQTARELYGEDGASSVAVAADEGVDNQTLRDRIAERVGSDYEVRTGAEAAEQNASEIGQFLGFLTTALLVFAAVSLLVGSFLIYNTFNITVAQRTRELALLRAVGASRTQVLTSVLLEAFVVGLLGAAVGIAVGIAVAYGLQALLDAFNFSLPAGDLNVQPRTIIVALILGPVITVVSALVPALRSTRVPPVTAMRAVAAPPPSGSGVVRVLLGLLVLAGGVAALAAGLFADAGLPVVGTGAVLVLLGAAVLSPLVTRPIARVLGAPVAAGRGMPGTLARENSIRNPRRTASTAAALMIGLGLVAFVLIFTASFQASVNQTLDEIYAADYQIQPRDFNSFPAAVSEAVTEVEGVAAVSRIKTASIGVEGDTRFAAAVDPETIDQVLRLDVSQGAVADLDEGGIALDENLVEDLGLDIGDQVEVAFTDPDAAELLTLAAAFNASQSPNGSQAIVAIDRFAEEFGETADAAALLALEEGVTVAEIRPALDAALEPFPAAQLRDVEELREQVADQTNQLLGLVFALLFLSVIIALFGIANTLGLSVLERIRELGLLRAIGMSRAQARSMVRWEAVIVALLGAVLGLVIGIFFGWIFIRALGQIGLEAFVIPFWQLAVAFTLAGLAGVIAAVIPARRAARVDVLRAIAVE